MLAIHVSVQVQPDGVEAFRAATLRNAAASLTEPGVARFDVLQSLDDPTRFLLVEVYRTAEDPARHKQTAHYARWRDEVEPLMAAPRSAVKYANLFPDENGWDSPGARR